MRRADLRDVHLQRRVLAHERAGGAGVVEVDVREEQMADVAELEVALREPGLQRRNARRRPAVVEREAVVGLDDVAADVAGQPLVEQVDRLERGEEHPGKVADRSFDRVIQSPPRRGDVEPPPSDAHEASNVLRQRAVRARKEKTAKVDKAAYDWLLASTRDPAVDWNNSSTAENGASWQAGARAWYDGSAWG